MAGSRKRRGIGRAVFTAVTLLLTTWVAVSGWAHFSVNWRHLYLGLSHGRALWFYEESNSSAPYFRFEWCQAQISLTARFIWPLYWERNKGGGFDCAAPAWPLLVLLVLITAVWHLRARRGRVRQRAGFCGQCGYDLRGSPERCPECGHVREATA